MYPNFSLYLLSKKLRRYVIVKPRFYAVKTPSENDFGSERQR